MRVEAWSAMLWPAARRMVRERRTGREGGAEGHWTLDRCDEGEGGDGWRGWKRS